MTSTSASDFENLIRANISTNRGPIYTNEEKAVIFEQVKRAQALLLEMKKGPVASDVEVAKNTKNKQVTATSKPAPKDDDANDEKEERKRKSVDDAL